MNKITPFLIFLAVAHSQSLKEVIMDDFTLQSPAFKDGEFIPPVYSCEGKDISPPLIWSGTPEGTQSLALTCVDPDAPVGDWIHWVTWDIAPDSTGLTENIPPNEQTLVKQGKNSWGRSGYGGPCPPMGHGPHRYFFTLYALDKAQLNLSPNVRLTDLHKAMEGHILGKATTMGRYER